MQTHALGALHTCPVFIVTHYGMMYHRHVHPYLVFASGVQVQLHLREAIVLLEQSPVGPCPFAAVIGAAAYYLHAVGVLEPTLHMAFVLLHLAFHHCHIAAVDDGLFPIGGEHLLHFHALGIHHQPGGAGIEPVHHMRSAALAGFHKVAVEQVFHIQAIASHAHREHFVGFIHHYHIVVLIHHIEKRGVIESCSRPSGMLAYLHYHLGLNFEVELGHHFVLHKHSAPAEYRFRFRPAYAIEFFHHKVEQSHLFARHELGILGVDAFHAAHGFVFGMSHTVFI